MTARAYLLQLARNTLTTGPTPLLKAVYGSRTMVTPEVPKPYAVMHMGNDTEDNIAPTDFFPHTAYVTFYVHDVRDPPSYTNVDIAIRALRDSIRANPSSAADRVMEATPLETSQDLEDQVLRTVLRYLRIQLVMGG